MRRIRKKYETPHHPWYKPRLEKEVVIVGEYGLRNKRELWRAETLLKKYKRFARMLLGMPEDKRKELENQILNKLKKYGILPANGKLEDILDLDVRSVLERRLQTVVFKKGLAKTIHQARQLIVHGHIAINGRRVTSPGYLVPVEEEDAIWYTPGSPFNDEEKRKILLGGASEKA